MALELDTHRFLHFELTHAPDGEDFHYLDIAKMLSEINRKSFRQGMTYDVANIVFHNSADDETLINVCTAPNTWVIQAAWQAGFRHWRQRINIAEDSLEDDDALTGPWSDFKVYLNSAHKAGTADYSVFIDVEDNTCLGGDWDYSYYTTMVDKADSDAKDNVAIMLMGPHDGDFTDGTGVAVSLLEVLENTIKTPTEDPSLPAGSTDSLWTFLSPDVADSEMIKQVILREEQSNDLPPYDLTVIAGAGTAGVGRPSDPWISRVVCIPGGGAHMAACGGFAAPCGLVVIETLQDGVDTIGVTLELVPGDYKGVSARPMRGGGR